MAYLLDLGILFLGLQRKGLEVRLECLDELVDILTTAPRANERHVSLADPLNWLALRPNDERHSVYGRHNNARCKYGDRSTHMHMLNFGKSLENCNNNTKKP